MKLPNSFRPEKDLEGKTKDLLDHKEVVEHLVDGDLQSDIIKGWMAYLDLRHEHKYNYTLCIYDSSTKSRYEEVNDAVTKAYSNDDSGNIDGLVFNNFFDKIDVKRFFNVVSESKLHNELVHVVYVSKESFKVIADAHHCDPITHNIYYIHIYNFDKK